MQNFGRENFDDSICIYQNSSHFSTVKVLRYTVSEIEQSAPYILQTRIVVADENSQLFVCCEQAIYVESSSVKDVIIALISTYFVYDIAYPKPLNAIFLFLQPYVFKLIDNQPLPPATLKLVGNLKKLK